MRYLRGETRRKLPTEKMLYVLRNIWLYDFINDKQYEQAKEDYYLCIQFIEDHQKPMHEMVKKKIARDERYYEARRDERKRRRSEGERKQYADCVCRWSTKDNNWVDEKTYWRNNLSNYSIYGANSKNL